MLDILHKNITQELGIDALEEPEKTQILERIGKLIYQGIMLRVVELLDEESSVELEKIIDTHGESATAGEKILEFIDSKNIDINKIVEEEVIRFKKESLETMSKLN